MATQSQVSDAIVPLLFELSIIRRKKKKKVSKEVRKRQKEQRTCAHDHVRMVADMSSILRPAATPVSH